MSAEVENGGPAFPFYENSHGVTQGAEGMTLRDYFAAKAMQAFICSPLATQNWIKEFTVPSSYALADAMLRERAK